MPDIDLSEFEQLTQRNQRRPCKVAAAFEQLAPADRKALDAALAADGNRITVGAIEKWLKRRSVLVPSSSISNHRRGRCQCHAA